MITPAQLLKTLSRHENVFKHYKKAVPCTVVAAADAGKKIYRAPLSVLQRRNYAGSTSNIVMSPYPDTVIPKAIITDFLWAKVDKWSELTAMVCGLTGRALKYKELKLLSRRLAKSLLKERFKPGDVIAMIMPNMPEFAVVALGILEAKLIVTAINPLYTTDEIAYQISNSKAVGIFTIPEKLDVVMEAKKTLENTKDYHSNLKVICTNDILGKEPNLPPDIGRYSQLVEESIDDSVLSPLGMDKGSVDDVALIPYSSGTTGRPKGVCLTHRNLNAALISMNLMGDVEDVKNGKQEVMPCILPAFHIYGWVNIILQGFYAGAKVITLPKFEEKSFLDVLNKYDCTNLYVAPPLILYLGNSNKITRDQLRSVKFVLNGAAPVASSDIEKCIKKSPPTVLYKQGYGLTEVTGGITAMEKGKNKFHSIGAVAANSRAKVIDLKTCQALGANQVGELCFKGPQVMKCYLNNKKATDEVIDSDGWFHTGDIGYYDEYNHFYVTDRLKELIKVKGFQVAPAELEGILRSHPKVDDAGVFGVQDPMKGEAPIGFVKIKKDANITEDELKAFLADQVATYKRIDTLVFVKSIPKSAAGKILRKDMKEYYLKHIAK